MASSGGFKASPAPPIVETGMRGFLKWYQREQPYLYQQIAPKIAATSPALFSDYNQSQAQSMRARAGRASLARRYAIRGRVSGLGQDDLSEQVQTLSESDLTPMNIATTDDFGGVSVPTIVDTSDAANTGAGSSTASTGLISALIGGATSLLTTNAQLQTNQAITNLQLQRAQQGLSPLNIGLNQNGIPTVGGSALAGGAGTLLLLGGGALLIFMMMGRRGGARRAA